MSEKKPSCSICAWRENCNKKYYIKDPSKCPDYTLDLTIPDDEDKEEKDED